MSQRSSNIFLILSVFVIGFTATSVFSADEELEVRNYWFPPLISFVLPGLDQWGQGDVAPAAAYSGLALGGLGLYLGSSEEARKSDSLSTRDNDVRLALLGGTLYQTMGSYSLFHSFKEIANTREDFSFVHNDEHVDDILAAPFQIKYLSRPTTLIPLAVVGALVASSTIWDTNAHYVGLTMGDVAFASGLSYLAGTGENAVFQGWMMPMIMKWTGSEFWSNFITSSVFAAAHLPRVNFPIVQFISGFYDGWLVQQSQWTIAETVFIHVWWDVIAFLGNYAFQNRTEPAMLRFPPVYVSF